MFQPKYVNDEALIRNFVLPKRRKRLMLLLRSPRGRKLMIESLSMGGDIDPRYLHRIPEHKWSRESIVSLLQRHGANPRVYLLSENPELDGQELDLQNAVEAVVGSGRMTLMLCNEGSLGYLEGAGPSDHYLLERDESRQVGSSRSE